MSNQLKPLSTGQSLTYCAGDISNNITYQLAAAFLLIYYTDIFGISPLAASTLFLVARVWDAINDPIIGTIVDKTNTRWGRFRPWVIFSGVPCAVFFIAMFTIPFDDMTETSKLIYAYVTYIGFGMAYTAVNLPYLSMITALSTNTTERAKLLALRQALSFIGIVGLAIVPTVLENSTAENPYFGIAVVAGGISLVLWLISGLATKERINLAEVTSADSAPKISIKGVLGYLRQNKPFLIIAMLMFVLFAQMAIGNSSGMYVFKYYLNDTSSLTSLMLSQMGGIVIGIIIVRKLIDRFDKKWLFAIGFGVGSLRFLSYLTMDIELIIAISFVCSIFSGFSTGTIWSFVPDTIEYGELKTGLRLDGISTAIIGFFWKVGFAVGGVIPGLMLDAYGYIPNQDQTAEAVLGIQHLGITIPVLFGIPAVILAIAFPITREVQKDIAEKLRTKHDEAQNATVGEIDTSKPATA
ncbi:MFS transporter [Photobacterium sp. OFAV2-7]|uniref:MFS transporter n=1 Tax=Photobacterium sp. OFAV2-7 TaxID=2917748 RepID=UPI001EF6C3AA|nr:MFS transporter [Photobacterium sp. OFAV2-7]MCG7585423.1 MFS transporter [Photobacterium sp. OFAV2-7]